MTQGVFTLLYNESYLAGALVLAISLRRILENRPEDNVSLGIIIDKQKLNDAQVSLLQNLYDEIIEVAQLESQMEDKLVYDLGRPELKQTFTKVQLWSLSKFEKILYLDADTLPNIPKDSKQGSIFDLLKVDFAENQVLAAPDSGFPDIFNSGVMLLKPNVTDYKNLVHLVEQSKINLKVSFDGADQGLLNQYFNPQPDWVQDLLQTNETHVAAINDVKSSNWIKLPFLYNVTPSTEYEYLPAYKHFANKGGINISYGSLGRGYLNLLPHFSEQNSQIKLVHFIGPLKPWNAQLSTGIYGQWWDIWYGYFGSATVDEVVYYDAKKNLPRFEKVSESTGMDNHTDANEDEQTVETKEQFDPSYLCDPANYQHIPTSVLPSVDSSWDPAKEPPPKPTSSKNDTAELDKGLHTFQNVWDSKSVDDLTISPTTNVREDSDQHSSPTIGHSAQGHIPTHQEPSNDEGTSSFGHHVSQQPERVFGDDVVLSHTYMPRADPEPTPTESKKAPGLLEVTDVESQLEVLELESSLHAIDAKLGSGESEDIPVDTGLGEIKLKKLFPWEFSESKNIPERTFD